MMKTKAFVLIAIPSVFLLSGCQLWYAIFPKTPVTLQQTLASIGYTELSPPSSLTPPGTIVEVVQQSPLLAETVCTQGQNIGSTGAAGVVTTVTNDTEVSQKVNATFDATVDVTGKANGSVDLSAVSTVSETLSNAKVLDLSVASALLLAKNRAAECKAAVAHVKTLGKPITLITSALVADVVYKVTWNDSATVAVKTAQLGALSASLGVGLTAEGDSTITGTQLIWGVKDDSTLVDLPTEGVIPEVTLGADVVKTPHQSRSIFKTSRPISISK